MSSDMDRISRSVLLLCFISVTHANIAPEFPETVYRVCEDTPVGEPAFTIQATDPEGDRLTFEISGRDVMFFEVDASTGVVSVKLELDRERGDVLELGVTVSDGFNDRSEQLIIILNDANDNIPRFLEPSYDREVPENTSVGQLLFKVSATDIDTGNAGVVHYNIDEVSPTEGFDLFSISSSGEVKLKAPLSYTSLSTFYRLKINASDGGGKCFFPEEVFQSSSVFALITVLDVPDLDPTFIGLPYIARVEENSVQNTFVFRVIALDQDTGVNDHMLYSIAGSTADGLFAISESDGGISVQKVFDREVIGDVVTLTVKATESKQNIHGVLASTTTNVTINIVDVNDEKPKFYKCGSESCVESTEFTGEVLEHRLGTVPINMTVKDLDKTVNTEILLEGEHNALFSVEPQLSQFSENVVQLIIRDFQNLDYEKLQRVVLQVIAVDKEKTDFRSTATVTISILDANDNSPTFPNDTYKYDVTEHSEAGTEVATLTATDPDTMDQGNIQYRLLPDSILPIFDVEPLTGRIYVKSKTLLDRETRSAHLMTLQAVDTAGQIGTTVLEITVTDINDQSPVMNRDSYLEFVKEGEKLNIKIEATDSDEPNTENSRIVYAIVPSKYSDLFVINADTGVLTNRSALDREALDPEINGRIELTVTATDNGTPKRSNSVIVTINVEDVNDNTPTFINASYKFSVKEGEKGAFVGEVVARDLDQTTNFNRVSFSIIDGSFASFIIRTFAGDGVYNGHIMVDPDVELDFESELKRFTLRIEAADLEQQTAVAMVEVDVLDVNDERPEFQPSVALSVKENTTISEAVGRFIALDKDGNHSLVYELESVKCRCNNSMTACSWFSLDPTGEIRVHPEQIIDYEQCDQAVMTAQVVDLFTEKGENNSVTPGEIVINIEDINDNAPQFIYSDSVFVVVSETASQGTSVSKVTALDLDSGVNRQIEFKVITVQLQDLNDEVTSTRLLFEAITTQQQDTYVGIIQTTELLDMSLQGKYLVTVTATDTGGLYSNSTLEIFMVDGSYKVELEFELSRLEVEQKLNEIRRTLMDATKTEVQIVAQRSVTEEATRASESTIIEAYFVYFNGTALTSDEVTIMLSSPEYYPRLVQLGLKYIGQSSVEDPEVNLVQYILLGMVLGLIVVLVALTTSLLCTRRSFKRKLKAANAMKSASTVISDNQKGGAVVPGTNKYTQEGANPVLNLNIESSIALDLDAESLDVDKVSLNSLDYNDDMTSPGKGTKVNLLMIEEAEDEDHHSPPGYFESLGEALAHRGQRKTSDRSLKGITNPAFNTTDL